MRGFTIGLISACVLWTFALNISLFVVKTRDTLKKNIDIIAVTHLVNLISVLFAYILEIKRYAFASHITSSVSYSAVVFIIYMLHGTIMSSIPKQIGENRFVRYFPIILFSVSIILYISSYWTHIFYSVNDEGIVYEKLFPLSQTYIIVGLADTIVGLYFSIKMRDRIRFVFASFIIIVAIFYPFTQIVGNSAPLNLGLTLGLQYLYTFVIYRREISAIESRREIAELNSKIMVSQIQPHFVFNSLSSIIMLCKKEPNKAAIALSDFSEYLRMNIDTLSTDAHVPFEKELDHINTYVKLERLRFEDKIEIEYEIDALDFMIPPLVVQPLVENAIKHGICKRPEGGKIVLKSYYMDDKAHIIVEDNGMGFMDDNLPDDGRIHVGIENVRRRLSSAGGELLLSSMYNKGTKCEIIIPVKV